MLTRRRMLQGTAALAFAALDTKRPSRRIKRRFRSCLYMATAIRPRSGKACSGASRATAIPATGCLRSASPIRRRATTTMSPSRPLLDRRRAEGTFRLHRRGAPRPALPKSRSSPIRAAATRRATICATAAEKRMRGAMRRAQARRLRRDCSPWGANTTARGRSSPISTAGQRDDPGRAVPHPAQHGFDLYAQPDGAYIGHPGMPTNVTFDGPALKGALMYRSSCRSSRDRVEPARLPRNLQFIVGRAPSCIAIVPEADGTLNGMVTGSTATRRPTSRRGREGRGPAVDPRHWRAQGRGPLASRTTGADGVWGPLDTTARRRWNSWSKRPASSSPTSTVRRSRARSLCSICARRSPAEARARRRRSYMNRPRGYFGQPRDAILIDGKPPDGIPRGVPATWRCR